MWEFKRSYDQMTVIGSVEGTHRDERGWHRRFQDKRVDVINPMTWRIHREWFRLDSADLTEILGWEIQIERYFISLAEELKIEMTVMNSLRDIL